MQKYISAITLFLLITGTAYAEGPTPKEGFSFVELKDVEPNGKAQYYHYWNDYVDQKNRDNAIYRYYAMPFYEGSSDTLLFLSVFDMFVCGVNNCPYQVVLKKNDGTEKKVLEGIGPDAPEYMFSVKTVGNAPTMINVGKYIFSYDEKAGKYVDSKK